jgi:hypothetical protein
MDRAGFETMPAIIPGGFHETVGEAGNLKSPDATMRRKSFLPFPIRSLSPWSRMRCRFAGISPS